MKLDFNEAFEKVKKLFLGKDTKKLNCAQAIIETFLENSEITEKFCNFGGGNAPFGYCGAYYAGAKILTLKKYFSDKSKLLEFEKFFTDKSSSLYCKTLKKNKFSCIKCLEIATEFLCKNLQT